MMIIQYNVNVSSDKAFNILSDFKKFGALHPYMTRVEEVGNSFLVEEVVQVLGFIKVPNQYLVQVTSSISDRSIIYRSQIKPSVSLEIVWNIEVGDPVTITEIIHIEANAIIKFILGSIMKKVHQKVINRLQ